MKKILRSLCVFPYLLLIFSCGRLEPDGRDIPKASSWPTTAWETSLPEDQGIDSDRLSDLLEFIKKNHIGIHSLLLIRNGCMVLDAYFYPFTPGGSVHDVASLTKSVTSALIGIAIDKGYISSADQPMLSYFPERMVRDVDRKKVVTIKDLASMRSGFDCGLLPGERELYAMIQTDDYIQSILELPMAFDPGVKYSYCSGNMHLLSAIISEASGKNALDFAREHLFGLLGINHMYWPADAQGITHGWGDLKLHPHDMAKIGYLYLHDGKWNGKQIISSGWVEESIQSHSSLSDTEGYGFGWWLQSMSPTDQIFYASGRGGQKIFVWPLKKIIVVLTGGGYDFGLIQQRLLSVIRSDNPIPENPDGYKRLQYILSNITDSPHSKQAPPLPETAKRISGKQYQLEKNSLAFKTMSLSFDSKYQGVIKISRASDLSGEIEEYVLPIGLDDVYAIVPGGPLGMPWGAKGHWQSADTFMLDVNMIANINRFKFMMTFAEEMVIIALDEETGMPSDLFKGYAER